MVIVLDCHEAESLQHTIGHLSHRGKDFGHAVHRSCLRLKGNFDEVALSQRLRQTEQSSGYGDGLKFCFGAAAVL